LTIQNNGARTPDGLVGENVFGAHTSTVGAMHINIMSVVTSLEKERLLLLVPYDFDEESLPRGHTNTLSLLDTLLKELRNSMIGLELYGQMKQKKGELDA
jgi:hypothetical protein